MKRRKSFIVSICLKSISLETPEITVWEIEAGVIVIVLYLEHFKLL